MKQSQNTSPLTTKANSKNNGLEPSFYPQEGQPLDTAPLNAGDNAILPNGKTAKVACVLCCGEGQTGQVRYYFGNATPRNRMFLYGYELDAAGAQERA